MFRIKRNLIFSVALLSQVVSTFASDLPLEEFENQLANQNAATHQAVQEKIESSADFFSTQELRELLKKRPQIQEQTLKGLLINLFPAQKEKIETLNLQSSLVRPLLESWAHASLLQHFFDEGNTKEDTESLEKKKAHFKSETALFKKHLIAFLGNIDTISNTCVDKTFFEKSGATISRAYIEQAADRAGFAQHLVEAAYRCLATEKALNRQVLSLVSDEGTLEDKSLDKLVSAVEENQKQWNEAVNELKQEEAEWLRSMDALITQTEEGAIVDPALETVYAAYTRLFKKEPDPRLDLVHSYEDIKNSLKEALEDRKEKGSLEEIQLAEKDSASDSEQGLEQFLALLSRDNDAFKEERKKSKERFEEAQEAYKEWEHDFRAQRDRLIEDTKKTCKNIEHTVQEVRDDFLAGAAALLGGGRSSSAGNNPLSALFKSTSSGDDSKNKGAFGLFFGK